MADDEWDLRKRAAKHASWGNYWAGKVLALLDENEKLRAAAARTSEPVHIEFRGNIPDPEKLRELIARKFGTRPGDDG